MSLTNSSVGLIPGSSHQKTPSGQDRWEHNFRADSIEQGIGCGELYAACQFGYSQFD
jgi:hypothetical protein